MAVALDGHNHAIWSSGTLGVSLTTANANDVIVVAISQQASGFTGDNVTSVTCASTGSWTQRSFIVSQQNSSQVISFWYAIASGALTSATITITFTVTPAFADAFVFGVTGANTTTPWDSGAGSNCPLEAGMATIADMLISTHNANTMVLAYYKDAGDSSPTSSAPWTTIDTPYYALLEYDIVSSPQTNLDATFTTTGTMIAGLGDAIVAATVVASPDALSAPIFRLRYPPWR